MTASPEPRWRPPKVALALWYPRACGHLAKTSEAAIEPCPFCADAREAREQDMLARLRNSALPGMAK